MPLFDLRCTNCGEIHKDVLINRSHMEHFAPRCQSCGKIGGMGRLPAASNFKINGFSASNGYSNGGRK